MRRHFLGKAIAAPSLGILLMVSGCSKKDPGDLMPKILPPAKAGAELESAFAAPGAAVSPQITEQVKIAQQALAQGDTDLAYGTLQQLKAASTGLSPQQDMAVRNAILGLIHQTIAAAAAGDPKAKEMVKRMQQTQ
jgi:hypothetical protein